MLRWAVAVFAVVLALLIALAVAPTQHVAVPSAAIELRGAALTLYPRSDPAAVWHFASPSASYYPDRQETVLDELEDGRRTVAGATDFTLHASQVTIDRNDNLRGQEMRAHLIADELDLVMSAKGTRSVLIDQGAGRFEVPRAVMSGPDLGESVFEDMRISFDFTEFEAGGPGTVGYAQFVIDNPGGRQ